jgi:hypothetical protein
VQAYGVWLDAPDLDTQKRIAVAIQEQFFQDLPYIPLGQVLADTAYRRALPMSDEASCCRLTSGGGDPTHRSDAHEGFPPSGRCSIETVAKLRVGDWIGRWWRLLFRMPALPSKRCGLLSISTRRRVLSCPFYDVTPGWMVRPNGQKPLAGLGMSLLRVLPSRAILIRSCADWPCAFEVSSAATTQPSWTAG